MKNKAEEFRKRLREVGAYSKEETEFLKKVKNKSEQGKMNEKYTFIPTAKEFEEHINATLGIGILNNQIDDDKEIE